MRRAVAAGRPRQPSHCTCRSTTHHTLPGAAATLEAAALPGAAAAVAGVAGAPAGVALPGVMGGAFTSRHLAVRGQFHGHTYMSALLQQAFEGLGSADARGACSYAACIRHTHCLR